MIARKYLYGATQAQVIDRLADERKAAKDGMLVLDERQTLGQFLGAVGGTRLEARYAVALACGLRRGDALGLL
jgi:hypothetical protein